MAVRLDGSGGTLAQADDLDRHRAGDQRLLRADEAETLAMRFLEGGLDRGKIAEFDLQRRVRTAVADMQLAQHADLGFRSEEHTSELQSLMRISYAVFCLKKKKNI